MTDATKEDSVFPRSIYELLDAARDRPGMYGITAKSFRALRAFLAGLWYSTLPEGNPSIWEFDMWVGVKTDARSPSFPLHRLMDEHSDDAAYERWFELLDEFRQCKVIELARLPASMLRSKSFLSEPNGSTRPAPVPDWISIGQYAPSHVFFLEESTGGRLEKCPVFYYSTVNAVMTEAERHWDVDPSLWNLQRLLKDEPIR